MSVAAWAPMIAPPLPARNDPELDTCEHAYPAETCTGEGAHIIDAFLEGLASQRPVRWLTPGVGQRLTPGG